MWLTQAELWRHEEPATDAATIDARIALIQKAHDRGEHLLGWAGHLRIDRGSRTERQQRMRMGIRKLNDDERPETIGRWIAYDPVHQGNAYFWAFPDWAGAVRFALWRIKRHGCGGLRKVMAVVCPSDDGEGIVYKNPPCAACGAPEWDQAGDADPYEDQPVSEAAG